MNIIQLFGIVLITGLAAGRIFERLGIPRVVGFIVVGLILGESVAQIFTLDFLDNLSPITSLALALIGFMVGGELKYPIFKKFGKQFLTILLCEGLLAMFAVAILVTIWTGNGREREERKIKLTTPQGKFLYHLPFPKAEALTVEEIMRKAGINEQLAPEIIDLVQLLEKYLVIESIEKE